MRKSHRTAAGGAILFAPVFAAFLAAHSFCQAPAGALTADQVISRLEQRNAERAKELSQFQGTRTYRMQYRGFPSDKDAEMVVKVTYKSPDKKEFTVVSQTGSKFIIDRVFKKLLEGEQEAQKQGSAQTALSSANYDFTLDHFEPSASGGQYLLNAVPKSKNKFLFRGKIWIDGADFAVARVAAEPAKNPSFWIKKSEIEHTYVKVNGFWLPHENHTESQIRLGGRAILSIEYSDYTVVPANVAEHGAGTHAQIVEVR